MIYKLRAFYDPSGAEALPGSTPEQAEGLQENGELLNELKKHVLDSKKLSDDTKDLIKLAVLNADESDFDMDKMQAYLSKNWSKETKATVIVWQVLLKKKGMYEWEIDWIKGPKTKNAINKLLWWNDPTDISEVSNKLLEELPAPSTNPTEGASENWEQNLDDVEEQFAALESKLNFSSDKKTLSIKPENLKDGVLRIGWKDYKESVA